jgi:hypothetical protein
MGGLQQQGPGHRALVPREAGHRGPPRQASAAQVLHGGYGLLGCGQGYPPSGACQQAAALGAALGRCLSCHRRLLHCC